MGKLLHFNPLRKLRRAHPRWFGARRRPTWLRRLVFPVTIMAAGLGGFAAVDLLSGRRPLSPPPAAAVDAVDRGSIVGRASVIDGDTIEIQGERIRLWGIDAPEGRQTCRDRDGEAYRCGQRAALALADWLDAAQPIRCERVDRDRYGRTVATCFRRGEDVAAWLVRSGHALDWPRYSGGAYAEQEAAAKATRAGIWAGAFQPPWEWRRR